MAKSEIERLFQAVHIVWTSPPDEPYIDGLKELRDYALSLIQEEDGNPHFQCDMTIDVLKTEIARLEKEKEIVVKLMRDCARELSGPEPVPEVRPGDFTRPGAYPAEDPDAT